MTISRQILDLMQESIQRTGSSMLLVSRDLGVVAHYCRRIAVVYAGQIVEIADVETFFADAIHPYSRKLLRAAAAAHNAGTRASTGTVSERTVVGQDRCSFAARCPIVLPSCRESPPPLATVGAGHVVRCFRGAEIAAGAVTP